MTVSGHIAYDGAVYFIHSNNGQAELQAYNENLEALWSYSLGKIVQFYQIAIGRDRTVFVSTSDALFALNPDGSLNWKLDTEGSYQLAIALDGTLFASCQDKKLRAIDPQDGQTLRIAALEAWFQRPPVIGLDNRIYLLEGSAKLSCFGSESFNRLASTQTNNNDDSISPQPKLALNGDGDVFVYGVPHGVVAYDKDCNYLWGHNYSMKSNLAIDKNGTVYMGWNEYLTAQYKDNGHEKWYVRVPDHRFEHAENYFESISLGENYIYAMTVDSHLLMIDYNGTVQRIEESSKGYGTVKPILRADGLGYVGDHHFIFKVDLKEQGFQKGAPWPYAYHDPRNSYNLNAPTTTSVEDENPKPSAFIAASAYPNPFNPTTTIAFSLPEAGETVLSIYSVNGQKVATVADEWLTAGNHSISFDGSGLSSGVYLYRIESGGQVASGKMLLMK